MATSVIIEGEDWRDRPGRLGVIWRDRRASVREALARRVLNPPGEPLIGWRFEGFWDFLVEFGDGPRIFISYLIYGQVIIRTQPGGPGL